MKYVLDSSVALKWVLPEPESAIALRLRDDYNNGMHALIAPDLFMPEIANGLAAAERQRRIKTGEAILLLHDVVRSAPTIHPTFSLLARAIEIAISTRHAVYDCVYVALAESEGCQTGNSRRPVGTHPAADVSVPGGPQEPALIHYRTAESMIDHAAARSLVQQQLAAEAAAYGGDECVVLDQYTFERDWGWVFFYNSRRYQETGDFSDQLAGNAPYFVRKADGAVFVAGTALPVEEYIADFESERLRAGGAFDPVRLTR